MKLLTNVFTIGFEFPAHLDLIQGIYGYNTCALEPMDQLCDLSGKHFQLFVQFQLLNQSKDVLDQLTGLFMRFYMAILWQNTRTFPSTTPMQASEASTQPSLPRPRQTVKPSGRTDNDWKASLDYRMPQRSTAWLWRCLYSLSEAKSVLRHIIYNACGCRPGCRRRLPVKQGSIFTQQYLKILTLIIAMSQPDPKQQCIQEYRQRMSKLFQDKKFISLKLLRNTHEIAMESSIKSVERDAKQDYAAEELEMLANQELNKIVEQVMEINYGWGKNFVESQFGLIENRLKSKELKLVSSIKGEFNLFIEYFHKKAEPLGCKKLEYFFEEFIIEKAFDYSTYVYEAERRSNQQELTVVKSKLAERESEIKELKRQISRQTSQALKTVENLQQSITYHKNRSQLLQSTINQLKSDRQTSQLEHESKLQSLQSQFLSSFSQHKEEKSLLSEEVSTAKRAITVLESQIQKEKQMHRQTHQHYKAMLQEFKIREDELKEEISDITMRASQEIQDYKRDTERSLNRSSVCRSQQEKEGVKLNQQLGEMTRKYDELEKAYSNLEYQMQLKKTQQEIARNDLEIALKLAEQRVCQYESRLPRYKKFQSELESYQKLHEEFTNQQKESQKQTALLRQQNTFILQQLKQLQGKYEGERRHSADCKKQFEELQEKVDKMNKVKVNEWVQTEGEGKLGEMLQQALKVVEVLEVEYGKVKAENARLRYKLHQY